MWEVIAHRGEIERRIVLSRWNRAKHHAKQAMDRGWKVRIRSFYADILIAEPSGDFLIVARKVRPQEAARFSILWFKRDDPAGCVWWPHGKPLPSGWRVIDG